MTVVIDVGAARYGDDYSMERLIDQFHPGYLYALDPNPELARPEPLPVGTEIHLIFAAAWTHDGEIGYQANGLYSWVTDNQLAPKVPCIDLAHFIVELAEQHDDQLVLKLDCEGAEYELLDHLIHQNADELLDLVLVEWHPKLQPAHDSLSSSIKGFIRCELREWPY